MTCFDARDSVEYQFDELQLEHNKVMALLCKACRQLEEKNGQSGALLDGSELSEWWMKHKAKDRQRQEKEDRERAEALNRQQQAEYLRSVKDRLMGQLTDDEKRALGIIP